MTVSVILLAGGVGRRMGGPLPKQYMKLHDKPVIQYSLSFFFSLPEVTQVIVVCAPDYRKEEFLGPWYTRVEYAEPGERRQDSMEQGFCKVDEKSAWVCVHDAARPYLTEKSVRALFDAGQECGAATLGVPAKATIKQVGRGNCVERTLDRSTLWEIHTPQIIRTDLLRCGLAEAKKNEVTVTDDVSLVELLGESVQVVRGDYENIKVTTPEDLLLLERVLESFLVAP